jgi:hypothetical protein
MLYAIAYVSICIIFTTFYLDITNNMLAIPKFFFCEYERFTAVSPFIFRFMYTLDAMAPFEGSSVVQLQRQCTRSKSKKKFWEHPSNSSIT